MALSGLGPSFVAGECLGIPRVHSYASFPVSNDSAQSTLHEQLESTPWCFELLSFNCLFLVFVCRNVNLPHSVSRMRLRPGAPTGAKETRTPNIQLAKLALYQLSYNPSKLWA